VRCWTRLSANNREEVDCEIAASTTDTNMHRATGIAHKECGWKRDDKGFGGQKVVRHVGLT
jgi:hypothetical protein